MNDIEKENVSGAAGRSSISAWPLQVLPHYPAIPPPLDIPLTSLPDHSCPYLPGRVAGDRAIWAGSAPAAVYEKFMDAGFRRSGKLLYQPACRGCRDCLSIRVPLQRFQPNKSQRRCVRRNADLVISHDAPRCSDEKFALYCKYVSGWHGRTDVEGPAGFESFLYHSPLESTIEFEYRCPDSRLLAVGICDLCPSVLSSVYLYFDPTESQRGLGTFAALHEIAFARQQSLQYYYLGYWVRNCRSMEYKQNFGPNEVLCGDGIWRPGMI